MKVTYIQHSCFLAETDRFYYLFDYASGDLPNMDGSKPIYVLFSHGHDDHYNPEVLPLLEAMGMNDIRLIVSDDIAISQKINALRVSAGQEYTLDAERSLITLQSTDVGVAFLIEDQNTRIYHAGDLNDWVWEEETEEYNRQMTDDYRRQIHLLSEHLLHHALDVAFVVLDPRQEKDYDRGMMYFLEHVPVKQVYPMHYWGQPAVIETFLTEHPEYSNRIYNTEHYAFGAEKR